VRFSKEKKPKDKSRDFIILILERKECKLKKTVMNRRERVKSMKIFFIEQREKKKLTLNVISEFYGKVREGDKI